MLNIVIKILWLGMTLGAVNVSAERLEGEVLKFTSTDDKTQGETCFLLQEKVEINWGDLISSGVTSYPTESYLKKNLWKYQSGSSAYYRFNAPLPNDLKGRKYFVFGASGAGVVEATYIKGTAVYKVDHEKSNNELSLTPKFKRARLCFKGDGGVKKPLFVARITGTDIPIKIELKQIPNNITFNFEEVESKNNFTTSMYNFVSPKKVMYKDKGLNKYLAISYPDIDQCGEQWQLIHMKNGRTEVQDYKGGNSC